VVDFRKMSLEEILDFIINNPKHRCGIFLKNQVELNSNKRETKRLGSVWLLSLIGLLGITNPSYSQTLGTSIQEQTNQIKITNSTKLTSQTIKKVHGKIFSAEDKGSLPDVIVLIKGKAIGTTTNLDGEFELEIPDSLRLSKFKIIISFIGFATQEKKVSLKENSVNIGSVYLQEDDSVLGPYGLNIPKESFWNQITRYFKKEVSTVNS
jgi:hypothetical protein